MTSKQHLFLYLLSILYNLPMQHNCVEGSYTAIDSQHVAFDRGVPNGISMTIPSQHIDLWGLKVKSPQHWAKVVNSGFNISCPLHHCSCVYSVLSSTQHAGCL